MIMRPLGRQSSMGQGKRLSARALLGAFGPMGLSAVLFDLQGKIDADQLQAAQVHDLSSSATALYLGSQRHVDIYVWMHVRLGLDPCPHCMALAQPSRCRYLPATSCMHAYNACWPASTCLDHKPTLYQRVQASDFVRCRWSSSSRL